MVFSCFFFDTNLLFNVYIGSIYILQGRGGLRWAVVTKTGHRFSFFFFFHTNLLFDGYIGSIDVLKGPGGLRWVAVTKTGPNDASGVVWAICNNVWFFLVFFFDTNLLFNGYIGSIDVLKGPGGLHWVAVTKTGSLLVRMWQQWKNSSKLFWIPVMMGWLMMLLKVMMRNSKLMVSFSFG